MSVEVLFVVDIPGPPVGKGRPRFARRGKFVAAYTPEPTQAWEDKAVVYFRGKHRGPPLDEPIRLHVEAVAARPKSLLPKSATNPGGLTQRRIAADPGITGTLWRMTKPDGDNVLKCVADALVAAGVIRDDVCIVDWHAQSFTASVDEGPYVRVFVERVGSARSCA